jgi:hypothetical protein
VSRARLVLVLGAAALLTLLARRDRGWHDVPPPE